MIRDEAEYNKEEVRSVIMHGKKEEKGGRQ
jgi:hypothetical protein